MVRADPNRISVVRTYPSIVSGVLTVAVFALSLMVLTRFSSVDPRRAMLPFSIGFLLYMAVYFVVMVAAEPYVR